jgi:uncharacterized protein (TIGR02145 family)
MDKIKRIYIVFIVAAWMFLLNYNISAQKTIRSVVIGSQEWTTENLNVSVFRNGDTIPEAESDSDWAKAARTYKPAWCYYNNNASNGRKYGKLYNWYAVTDARGLAPKDWHIPTDAEWNILTDFLGGNKTAGIKMKSKFAWEDNGNGNNSSGFSGIPSGQRIVEQGFLGLGNIACFWASNEEDDLNAYYRPLTKYAVVTYSGYFKTAGFSVRCIKDNNIK